MPKPMSGRDRLLVSAALHAGAMIQQFFNGDVLKSDIGTVFATDLFLTIVADERNHDLTPTDIATRIANGWQKAVC